MSEALIPEAVRTVWIGSVNEGRTLDISFSNLALVTLELKSIPSYNDSI